MTTAEQADRTARNILELVQARRQLAAVRVVVDRLRSSPAPSEGFRLDLVVEDLDAALAHQPAPTSSDSREVPA